MSEQDNSAADPASYGGQALIEGVMIRGQSAYGIALRHPDGRIVGEARAVRLSNGWRTWPFIRGLVLLSSQMHLGWQLLSLSGAVATYGDRCALPRRSTFISWAIALAIAIGVFVALPMLLTERTGEHEPLLPLAEGLIKFAAFISYLALISRLASVRRLLSYHGAEHMAVHTLEAGRPLIVAEAQRFLPPHPRCGTAFLLILALLDTLILALLPRFGTLPDLSLRIFLLPLLIAIAYEVLRFGAVRGGIAGALNNFGMAGQRFTTALPDARQLEVALAALQLCLRAEGRVLPLGTPVIAVAPLPVGPIGRGLLPPRDEDGYH